MNQKETITKHAVRKAVTISQVMLLSSILLAGRSTCMTVQAVNEMQIQTENITEEVQQTEIESEESIQLEYTEGMTQVQAESAGVMAQTQTENAEDAAQMQAENAEDAAQMQAENTEDAAQTQAENAEGVAQEQLSLEAMSVTMIGDSVMLGAAPSILEMLPGCVIDAKVSRQVVHAGTIFDSLEEQNALGNTIVIALGTNGSFSIERGQKLIDRLGSNRTIYWVTVYGAELSWQEDSNATIRALAANNENVHLIEWSQAASEHAEWLCADGIHLNTEGQTAYAGIVLAGIS